MGNVELWVQSQRALHPRLSIAAAVSARTHATMDCKRPQPRCWSARKCPPSYVGGSHALTSRGGRGHRYLLQMVLLVKYAIDSVAVYLAVPPREQAAKPRYSANQTETANPKNKKGHRPKSVTLQFLWSGRKDSNLRPSGPKPVFCRFRQNPTKSR